MPTTPNWQASRNGLPTNVNAPNASTQANQLLGTHAITEIYEGTQILTPGGGPQFTWLNLGNATDLDQPFTMPTGHTSIGRITLPLQPTGAGADLLVTLYPDNGSGSPSTSSPIAATLIPAAWVNNLAAPAGLAAGGALATARFNTLYGTAGVTLTPWAPASSGPNGTSVSAQTIQAGNYFITAGGINPVTSDAVDTVITSYYAGGGILQLPVPQPALPQATEVGVVMATPNAVVYAGGGTATPTFTTVANVWVASWDPNTGTIGSWSAQTALPQPLTDAASASSGNTVYVIGGLDAAGVTVLGTVYFAAVTNGQITGWQLGPKLPLPVQLATAAVVNGWLIVAGGYTDAGLTVVTNAVYYAPINQDGSLGAWRAGPSLPAPLDSTSAFVTDSAMATLAGAFVDSVSVLTATAAGIADQWYSSRWTGSNQDNPAGAFANGDGLWSIISLNVGGSNYTYTEAIPVPEISVPLPATGLTPGSTYHVVLQQHATTSASDFLSYGLDTSALAADAKKSARHSGTWTTASSGYSMPLAIYDNTPSAPVLHTWEDPSSTGSTYTSKLASRVSTLVYNQQGLLAGILEATAMANNPLNSNPTFTSGVTPWVAHNCTFAQTGAQTHGGFAFSGLLTPNGTSTTVSATSELCPVRAVYPLFSTAEWYQVNGWLYSTPGYSNVSLGVDWYDATSTYISTSSTSTALAAATWTNVVNTYQPPATAAYASINVAEGGTPASSAVLYLSNVTIAKSPELTSTIADVAQIDYPAGALWPPVGVTQLA